MKHPAFETIPRALLFISIFILAGALVPLCLAGLISVKAGILIIQGAVSGLLICGVSVLMWYITRFTRLSGSNSIQGIFNHFALLAFALFVLIGTEFLIFYILFPEDIFKTLTSIIPFKIVIGLLVLMMVIQFYDKKSAKEIAEGSSEDENESVHEITVTESPSKSKPVEKITVKSGSNINIIPVSDLLYLQAEGDYVLLYTASTRFVKEETMKHLESQLPPSFLRVHRSCIVNTNYISRIELYEKQHYKITIKNGQQIKVSASGYKLLKENLHL